MDIEQLKNLFEGSHPPPNNRIWMNEITIKKMVESLPSSNDPLIQLYGIEVFQDNDIPDFHFETEIQRNIRKCIKWTGLEI